MAVWPCLRSSVHLLGRNRKLGQQVSACLVQQKPMHLQKRGKGIRKTAAVAAAA